MSLLASKHAPTDGLCALDCPVAINTGDLIKQLRVQSTGNADSAIASWLGRNFAVAERAVAMEFDGRTWRGLLFWVVGICVASRNLGRILSRLSSMARGIVLKTLNQWIKQCLADLESASIVYWPTCMSRMMGGNGGRTSPSCARRNSPCISLAMQVASAAGRHSLRKVT